MAWEWSHTQEAYNNAEQNVIDMINNNRERAEAVYAEIKGCNNWQDYTTASNNFDEDAYNKALLEAKRIDDRKLLDTIWNFANEYRTCDNGGFNAHICPHGCHTVPFNREEE